jgi:hypothetical protein
MLTRVHFVELSRAFRAVQFQDAKERESALWTLCAILAQTNPAFDRVTFMAAANSSSPGKR